jgi:hypothetical protein
MLKLKGKRKIDGRNTEKTSAYVVATPQRLQTSRR